MRRSWFICYSVSFGKIQTNKANLTYRKAKKLNKGRNMYIYFTNFIYTKLLFFLSRGISELYIGLSAGIADYLTCPSQTTAKQGIRDPKAFLEQAVVRI